MPPEITRVTEQFLHNPVRIEASRPATAATTITQRLVASRSKDFEKRDTLRKLITEAVDFKTGIIFANRKSEVAVLHKSLLRHEFKAVALHGDMDQRARMAALEAFKTGTANLLVASDVAARGLDIPDVSHVFNYDVPFHADDYVHRIGRTGRAGRLGAAFSIVTHHDEKSVAAIEKLIGQTIAWEGPLLNELGPGAPARDDDSRRRGRGREERGARSDRDHRRGRRDSREAPAREAAAREAPMREASIRESAPVDTRPSREETPVRDAGRGERKRDEAVRGGHPRASRPRDDARAAAPRREGRDSDLGPSVKGLGDHMPAFLMRPVKS
jgi:superfamily II DNA/RNA helicase